MLQYLIIILDETSVSYCHYTNLKQNRKLISIDVLKEGILFAMKENLSIQFVYPNYELPIEYMELISSVEHTNIMPFALDNRNADVVVVDEIDTLSKIKFDSKQVYVLRITKNELFHKHVLIKNIISEVSRLSIVISDMLKFKDSDIDVYSQILDDLSTEIYIAYKKGLHPQLNIVSDRMLLNTMNNCGAGDSSITLAPDGNFYICPAFYFEKPSDCINIIGATESVGNLKNGLHIKNKMLYKLGHAPICRQCDAYHCKRCVWQNRISTYEVNTPGHEQCVVSHIERNAARKLLSRLIDDGLYVTDIQIPKLDYLDPFNIVNRKKTY